MISRRKITLVLLVLAILFAGNLLLLQVGVLQTNTLVNTASATHSVCTGGKTVTCPDIHCDFGPTGSFCKSRTHTINFTCGGSSCNRNFWSKLSNYCNKTGKWSCSSGVGCEVLPSLKTTNSCSVVKGYHAPPPPGPLVHTIVFTSSPISIPVTYPGGGCTTGCSHSTTIDYPGTFRIEAPATKVSGSNTYDFIEWHVDAWTSTSRIWSIRLDDTFSSRTAIAHYRLRAAPPPPPTVDIKANGSNGPIKITYNTSATISWSSSNASSCSIPAPGGWFGLSGTKTTANLTGTSIYKVMCTGPGGSASDSVTVNVTAPPPPVCKPLSFISGFVSPSTVNPGATYTASCNYGAVVDSISHAINGSPAPCIFTGFSGTTAKFSCDAPVAPGAYSASCVLNSGTPSNTCPRIDGIGTLTVNATLTAAISPVPTSGNRPLPVLITDTAGGTAVGSINYSTWWNCTNSSPDVKTVEGTCGSLPVVALGTCASNANGEKCLALGPVSHSVSHTYDTVGIKTAKVIIERDSLSAEARTPFPVITVTDLPPTIDSFTSAPPVVNRGSATGATLNWSTTNVVSCSIDNGVGTVCTSEAECSSDSQFVTITADTTFRLTCENAAGVSVVSGPLNVNYTISGPVIDEFIATPGVVFQGGETTLSWVVRNIIPGDTGCSIDNGVGPVPVDSLGTGSVSATPPLGTVTYTLFCSNESGGEGGTASATLTVTVPFIEEVLP